MMVHRALLGLIFFVASANAAALPGAGAGTARGLIGLHLSSKGAMMANYPELDIVGTRGALLGSFQMLERLAEASGMGETSLGLLRLRGGYKGTSSMGKKGTGKKAHPSYKTNLSMPRVSRHGTRKFKRYTLHKRPERTGRAPHLRAMNQRFRNGFRARAPYEGPGTHDTPA